MKVQSQSTPDAVRTTESANPPRLFVLLTTKLDNRDLAIRFVDSDHCELFTYGLSLDKAQNPEEQTVPEGARRLYRVFRRWWEPTVLCRNSRRRHDRPDRLLRAVDLNGLAHDFVENIREAAANPKNIVGGVLEAPVFIEPDRNEEFWREKAELLHQWVEARRRFGGKERTIPRDRSTRRPDRPPAESAPNSSDTGSG